MHRKVLLVEDDSDLRDTVREILEDEGYQVEVAANGALALNILRSGCAPCLILLDLMMPVMDGYRFCVERARDTTIAEFPVVILSAVAQLDRSLPAGVASVMQKPVSVDALLSIVGQYCAAT